MKKYRYGMKYRGFSIGCQPMDGLQDVTSDKYGVYYNILGYDRRLDQSEVDDYELTYLGEHETGRA